MNTFYPVNSMLQRAKHNGATFLYRHNRTGTFIERADLLAIIGGNYKDGTPVRALDFRPFLVSSFA